ncbi:ABC transporter permease [Bosea thiooxidans]|nr:ABC transporter permease [Bosea sp. (in: a-proteobacteria)]
MASYVLKRLLAIVALTFGITIVAFLIIRLIPGDPVIAMLGTGAGDKEMILRLREQLGLNRPLPEQYLIWIGQVMRGDFGYSYANQQPVSSLIASSFPATAQLTLAALALSLLFGSAIGIAAAIQRNRAADTAGMALALVCMSIPSFWLGLLLILLFAVIWPVFDVVGGTGLKGLVLPAVTLALGTMGFNARFIRSSVIAALSQQHVVTARAKGLSEPRLFAWHVMRNALLPILTVVGLQIGQLLSGSVIVETVFSRPGIGRLLIQAILAKDYVTVQALIMMIALIYALSNFIVDILYPVLDPRIAR